VQLQTSWRVCLLSCRITSRTFAIISGVVLADGRQDCLRSSTDSRPSVKRLNHSNVLDWHKTCSPKASFGIRWVSAAGLLSLKQNLMQILCSNIRHFDNSRHRWKRCQENSQNSETHALIKTRVGWLTVERYSKRHVAAQFCSTNGLRGIFKFSEILSSNTYVYLQYIPILGSTTYVYLHIHKFWVAPRMCTYIYTNFG
jgi:hypothetical protein